MRLTVLFFSLFLFLSATSEEYYLHSPDKKIRIRLIIENEIYLSAQVDGISIIDNLVIGLKNNEIDFGRKEEVKASQYVSSQEEYKPLVKLKTSSFIADHETLAIHFESGYSLHCIAFNNGFAYRLRSDRKGEIRIINETINMKPGGDPLVYFPEETSLMSHYERSYTDTLLKHIEKDKFCSLPVYFKTEGISIVFTEADLFDYPGLFLQKTDDGLESKFPKLPIEIKDRDGSDRSEVIEEESDFIAVTGGKRSLPWRVFMVGRNDAELIENQMVFQLSRPCEYENTDWIKPGKVAWDWWNANNIFGVDFEAGINTDTYKYYIDFASEYGIEYIILDEGWSKTTNLLEIVPEINLKELLTYAESKNVGIILWVLWKPLIENMDEVLDQYKEWGIKGIKVDFMQRADQKMVNIYEDIAREAFERELLVDYHGAYKPAGLRRAYPNVLTYEGVKGLENSKWGATITPEHDVTIPFIRMCAGPMDYTPGAMINANKANFRSVWNKPMSQGTRAHQIAMYVIYESPLQMLCDNPSNYHREKECAAYISRIPVVWDKTIAIEGEIGEYLIVARKNGDSWYVGGMTNWDEREVELEMDFLDDGKEYLVELVKDGTNANRNAVDHVFEEISMKRNDVLKILMACGGGFTMIIQPK